MKHRSEVANIIRDEAQRGPSAMIEGLKELAGWDQSILHKFERAAETRQVEIFRDANGNITHSVERITQSRSSDVNGQWTR